MSKVNVPDLFKAKFRIEGFGMVGREFRVFLNDEDISHRVAGISFNVDVDSIARVSLQMIADEVIVNGEGVVLTQKEPVT